MADAKQFILHAFDIRQREQSFSHPWNPKSQLIGVQLSRALGLKRTAVNIARMPPGKESFVYRSHHHEEEWLYLSAAVLTEHGRSTGQGTRTELFVNTGVDDLEKAASSIELV